VPSVAYNIFSSFVMGHVAPVVMAAFLVNLRIALDNHPAAGGIVPVRHYEDFD
jgi:hypothetical protein